MQKVTGRFSMSYIQGGAQSPHTRGKALKRLVPSGFPFTLYKMLFIYIPRSEPGEFSRYSHLLRAGRSGDRNPVGGQVLHTRPDQPLKTLSRLYNEYRLSFSVVERPGRGLDNPRPSCAKVKERVQLYL